MWQHPLLQYILIEFNITLHLYKDNDKFYFATEYSETYLPDHN